MKEIDTAKKIAERVAQKGGRTFFVGGYVRDKLLNKENYDIDIEVHGISVNDLTEILDSLGGRIGMGESFGIFGIKGVSLDIAMPRLEKTVGNGHKDLEACVDPFVGVEKAAKRRDFTINALMEDVLSSEIVDPYNGREDINKKILRAVSEETFGDDPLRVLRAARFSATLGFDISPETIEICKRADLSALSQERVFGEMKKALLCAEKPSRFFCALKEMEQTDWFKELYDLIGIKQSEKYHPEGDAFEHTMCVIDEAAGLRDQTENPLYFMIAALCHDLGKAVTTELVNGDWHSYLHEVKGIPLGQQFLTRLTNEKNLIHYALNMTKHHMRPNACVAMESKIKSTNKIFYDSICPKDLILLSKADLLGRHPEYSDELFKRLEIYNEYMSRPCVTGKDLIACGITDGEKIGEALEIAKKHHLAGVPKKSALRLTLQELKKKNKEF